MGNHKHFDLSSERSFVWVWYYVAMSKFVFVRHGQSTANAQKKIAVDSTPLTDLGLEQARQTAREVRELGITIIACSPLIRAQQTAEAIAAELGIELESIQVIDELKERELGELKDKPKEHESSYFYAIDGKHNVESRNDTTKRMMHCLEKVKSLANKGTVLVVGHAVSGYYLLEVAAGKKHSSEFEPPQEIMNAEFVVVDIEHHKLDVVE